MKYLTHKIVLVIQDLKTKDEKDVAVVSGDIHYHLSEEDKQKYISLQKEISKETDDDRKSGLQDELLRYKHVASFQMALDSSKDFKRVINDLVMQAIQLKEEKKIG